MITGIFGLPRSGKTTYLAKLCQKSLKKGIPVYSNFPLKGAFMLDFETLGKLDYHDCVILIDEISLLCDSRDWQKFGSDLVYFFTHHAHYKIDIYYASQWFTDCDVKIRRMTEKFLYVDSFVFGLSTVATIQRSIATNEAGNITDFYSVGHRIPFVRCRYYKMFDSFTRKTLPPVDPKLWDVV